MTITTECRSWHCGHGAQDSRGDSSSGQSGIFTRSCFLAGRKCISNGWVTRTRPTGRTPSAHGRGAAAPIIDAWFDRVQRRAFRTAYRKTDGRRERWSSKSCSWMRSPWRVPRGSRRSALGRDPTPTRARHGFVRRERRPASGQVRMAEWAERRRFRNGRQGCRADGVYAHLNARKLIKCHRCAFDGARSPSAFMISLKTGLALRGAGRIGHVSRPAVSDRRLFRTPSRML